MISKMGFLRSCVWYFYGIAMGFLWDVHGGSLEFLKKNMRFLWNFHASQWSSSGISLRFLWDFHDVSLIFL